MLIYFAYLLSQRRITMVFYSRNTIKLISGIQNYARPFEEILFSFDSTTNATSLNNDNDYFNSNAIKDCLT